MSATEWPCGNCGASMYSCFTAWNKTKAVCCEQCDKHGFRLTDRGHAAVEAMDDGFSFEDAITLHGKRGDDT